MKFKYILGISAIAASAASYAQNWQPDTVSMGENYIYDVFYNFEEGQAFSPNNNWHIAVQSLNPMGDPHGGVGIWTNEATKNGPTVNLYNLGLDGSNFLTIGPSDTAGKRVNGLKNSSTTYAEGAFNQIGGDGQMDFGWGTYHMEAKDGFPAHSVIGDSLFLLELGEGGGMGGTRTIIKSYVVWPRALATGRDWTLYAREIDGTEVDTIQTTIDTNSLFKYYNLIEQKWKERELARASWDLLWTNYMDFYGTSGIVAGVTGVLANYNITVAQVDDLEPNDADYEDLNDADYKEDINIIGSDWKQVNMTTFEYDITENQSWFVKRANGDIWQIYFDLFGKNGGTENLTGLQKRKVYEAPVSVKGNESIVNSVVIAPNPTSAGSTNLLIDAAKSLDAKISIVDLNGRTLLSSAKTINAGFHQLRIDLNGYNAGIYFINIQAEGFNTTHKIVVQ